MLERFSARNPPEQVKQSSEDALKAALLAAEEYATFPNSK